jgi:HSP20 family molecular chaperone IbpA
MTKAHFMRDPLDWMMSEAIEKLDRAERMHRKFFRLHAGDPRQPAWEPPIDVLETAQAVLIFVALPGVNPDTVEAMIKDGALIVSGRRVLPAELASAVIHRLELPQGTFERRISLPAGRYSAARRFSKNGCVVFSLEKLA